MPEQGKLPLSLIPTGYNIRDNEDRTSSARLATKQIWGLLSQQRLSKLHLKNYPQDSLPCQDLPNMFFCQNNPGLQWSGKNILGLTIPTKLSGKVQIYPYGWTACTFSNAKKVTTKTTTRMRWVREGKGPHYKHCSCGVRAKLRQWKQRPSCSRTRIFVQPSPGDETLEEHSPKCHAGFLMEQKGHLLPLALDNGSAWALPVGQGAFRRLWVKVTTTSTTVLCWKDWKSPSGATQADYSNIVACKQQVSWAQLTGFHLAAPVSSLDFSN